jgi:hypothetical protein
MPKRRLFRKGQTTQRTETGFEIPVPRRKDVFDLFDRAARKRAPGEPSESETGTRRTSPDP